VGVTGAYFGLYIGVDRYQSIQISNLASAVRDAKALHALFSDNLTGEHVLLVDDDATTARLRDELRAMQAKTSGDDFVVITFSGHGSDTHEIVSFDTDYYDIPGSGLPLDEFTDLVSGISARHLLVVLDCCFSGDAGAKVLHAPRRSRGSVGGLPKSTEAFLQQMVGTGRVILTASTADQEAWEDPRIGHGYLTYHLLQALLGSANGVGSGVVELYSLLQYVTRNVIASASGTYGARQEPTLRGQWDGDVTWPAFVPGAAYNALFPTTAPAPVTRAIDSLSAYGMPSAVLSRWAEHLPGLNQLQQDAVNLGGLFDQRNMLVMAPTSSGKTMIGELAALRATQIGGRSVFLLPTKALVNEQYDRFKGVYGPAGVRVIRATGDHHDDVPALLRGQFDMALFTYERFTGLALTYPYLLRLISIAVVDEVQNIVDPSRGINLELLLTLIRSRADDGVRPQVIALSAVLGALNGLDSWLDAYLLQTTERPVPLDEGVLASDGSYRYLDAGGAEHTEQLLPSLWAADRAQALLIPLLRKLVGEGQQVIVVRGERGAASGAAQYLAGALGLAPAQAALDELPADDVTHASAALRRALSGGVAFHSTDLGPEERRVVEDHFRASSSSVRVVVSTTTLAQGVNLPAETVVLAEVNRRIGRNMIGWYTVAEYKNIVGRAGRLGHADRGRAITLSWNAATTNRIWSQYVNGTPESIESVLLDPGVDLATLVLRLVGIASKRAADDDSVETGDLSGILANSLAAHQARLARRPDAFNPADIVATIAELTSAGLLEAVQGDRTRPSGLGKLVADSILTVRSAVRVASALHQMTPQALNRTTLLSLAQVTTELDETRLNVNNRGVGKEWQTFTSALTSNGVAPAAIGAMRNVSNQTVAAARAKKAAACMLWVSGVGMADIERFVMRHYFNKDASAAIRQVVSRTQDVISTVVAMALEVHPTADITTLAQLLPSQLGLGVPGPAAALAVAGADLRRADYVRLSQAELGNFEAVLAADDATLLPLLGNSAARLATLRAAAQKLCENARVDSAEDLLGSIDPNA
jgi:replicative superfamily II helicase